MSSTIPEWSRFTPSSAPEASIAFPPESLSPMGVGGAQSGRQLGAPQITRTSCYPPGRRRHGYHVVAIGYGGDVPRAIGTGQRAHRSMPRLGGLHRDQFRRVGRVCRVGILADQLQRLRLRTAPEIEMRLQLADIVNGVPSSPGRFGQAEREAIPRVGVVPRAQHVGVPVRSISSTIALFADGAAGAPQIRQRISSSKPGSTK